MDGQTEKWPDEFTMANTALFRLHSFGLYYFHGLCCFTRNKWMMMIASYANAL